MNTSSTQSFEIDNHFQNLDQSKVNKSKKRLVVLFVVFLLIAINAIIYYKSMGKTITNRNSEVKFTDGGNGGSIVQDTCLRQKSAGMAAMSFECQEKYTVRQDMVVVDYGEKLCADVKNFSAYFQMESDCNPEMQYWWTNPYNSCDNKCQPLPGFYQTSKYYGSDGMRRPDNAWFFALQMENINVNELGFEFVKPCPIGYTSIKMFTFGTDLYNTTPLNYDCHLLKGWFYNCDNQVDGCHDDYYAYTPTYTYGKFWQGNYAAQPDATPCTSGRTTVMIDNGHYPNNYNETWMPNGQTYIDKINSNRICHLDEGYFGSSSFATKTSTRITSGVFRGHYVFTYPVETDIINGSGGFVLPTACSSGWSEGHSYDDHLYAYSLSTTACSSNIPVPQGNSCGYGKSRLTASYPCASGLETGSSCGLSLHSLPNTNGCVVIGGFYGLLANPVASKCPVGKTTPGFTNVNTYIGNCYTAVSFNNQMVANSGASYVPFVANQNVFSNMISWSDNIAARTVNKSSRNMFDDTCSSNSSGVISCVRGTMWDSRSWVRNNTFATLWARIDWSGIAVMTSQFCVQMNDFGHGVGATLIGGNVYFSAFHYIPSNLDSYNFGKRFYNASGVGQDLPQTEYRAKIIFLDINSTLRMYSVRPKDTVGPKTLPLRMFAPEPWYSDAAFQLIDPATPVSATLSTFPVPRLGMDIAVPLTSNKFCTPSSTLANGTDVLFNHCSDFQFISSPNLNYNYGTPYSTSYAPYAPAWATGPTYDGKWPTSSTLSFYNGKILAMNSGRNAVAPFNMTLTDRNVPVFQWNSLKQLKLSWTTYESLVRPVPSYDYWIGDRLRGDSFYNPGGQDTRQVITLITKKSPSLCINYCRGKYNLARGDRNGDSGSPAFIIVAGKPLLIGGLHMGTYSYATKLRDIFSAEADEEIFTTRSCASVSNVQPCDLIISSGISAITAFWDKFEKGMSTHANGWNIAKGLYQASFCGFAGTPACTKVKVSQNIS